MNTIFDYTVIINCPYKLPCGMCTKTNQPCLMGNYQPTITCTTAASTNPQE